MNIRFIGGEDLLIRTVRFGGGFIHLHAAEGTGSFLIWWPRQFDENLVCVDTAGRQGRDDVIFRSSFLSVIGGQ